MILVFGSFVLGGLRVIELFGVGLAGAVLLDAVVIRSAVVPAVMLLLGDANWRLPRQIARWLPHPEIKNGTDDGARAGARGSHNGISTAPEPARTTP